MTYHIVVLEAGERITERLDTDSPIEAEAAYFRLAATRTPGPALLLVDPDKADSAWPVAKSAYKLDSGLPAHLNREGEPDRMGLWTPTAPGYAPPTPCQLRGAIAALGWSQQRLARELGVAERAVRYWVAMDRDARRVPTFAEWAVIRMWLFTVNFS